MQGAVARAEELAKEIPNAIIPQQFENPANPAIHRRTTAEEIWNDTAGKVDVVISGVGTGGTITGVGQVLKAAQAVGADGRGRARRQRRPLRRPARPAQDPRHRRGLRARHPRPQRDRRVITIGNETAFATARKAAKLEGIPGGISSGAAVAAALEVGARKDMAGKTIVVIIPSFAERYLSTALFDGL